VELRRGGHLLLHLAMFSGMDQGGVVFFGYLRWNLDLHHHIIDQTGGRVGVHALYNSDVISRQVALAAEAEHINACAGSQAGKENREGGWCQTASTAFRGLIGRDSIGSKMRVHPCAAR